MFESFVKNASDLVLLDKMLTEFDAKIHTTYISILLDE